MLQKKLHLRWLLPVAARTVRLTISGGLGLGLQFTPAIALETAKSADRFIDTIGVVTHLHYTDTHYYKSFHSVIKPRLFELGIRHVRDHVYTYPGISYNSMFYQRCRELSDGGVKFNFVVKMQTAWSDATDYTKLADAFNWCNGAVASFEGINEPDLQGVPNWVNLTRQGQQQLFKTIKNNPLLAHLPVIGPSTTTEAASNALGDLNSYIDQGNIHNYNGGHNPEAEVWGSVAYHSTHIARPVSGNKMIKATETGWHNGINATGHPGTPEKIVAKYMPRLFLHHFNQKVTRTYIYEFLDQGSDPYNIEHNFGLLRYDGSPKPAFNALKNLIALLKDSGPSFTPEALDYTLTGNTVNVQRTLLQKRNGDFFLALWVGAQAWDPITKTEKLVPHQSITLTVPSRFSRATLHSFNEDGSVSALGVRLRLGKLNLNLSDRVMLIRLIARQ